MINGTSSKKCTILRNNASAERPFERAGISSRDPLKDNADYILEKVQFMMNEITNGNGIYTKQYSKSTKRVQWTHLRGYIQKQKENKSRYSIESLIMLNYVLDSLEKYHWLKYLDTSAY